VVNSTGTLGEYNATMGAAINANFFKVSGLDGIAVAPVPEPSTWSMIAVGGVALLGMMHRKKQRAA
jgi:PEP-CTERM motif